MKKQKLLYSSSSVFLLTLGICITSYTFETNSENHSPYDASATKSSSILSDNIDSSIYNNALRANNGETAVKGNNNNQSSTEQQDKDDLIEFQFENVSLEQLAHYMADMRNITFLTDDALSPLAGDGKSLKGHKVSFRTNEPLTKNAAWDLFLTFLDLAGFDVTPDVNPNIFRIAPSAKAIRMPIPTYIGTKVENLPNNDQIIRYIYFIKNSTIASLKPIIEALKSSSAEVLALQEHKAFMMIDNAYNIKQLMEIITELDKVSMPQSMSILKLHRADAEEVKALYEAIIQGDQSNKNRLFPPRKKPTALYFPEDIRIIAEPRTNSLILLGARDAIEKIELFIRKNIDVAIDKPYSPLNVIDLRYAEANTVAEIMQEVVTFGKGTTVAGVGGVRGGDKFFGPMSFTPEPETNRLIVKGDYEDFLRVREIVEQLDEPQAQVGVEVLILSLSNIDTKILGTQMRSPKPFGADGVLGDQITYQTSGLRTGPSGQAQGIVTNPNCNGIMRLLGDLVQLATGAEAGNTLVTLGDQLGVWAIMQALETIATTDLIASPFITVTNKTHAIVSIGEARRVVTSTVVGAGSQQDAFGTERANLTVDITPQINSDGMIVLDLKVHIDNFVGPSDPSNTVKNTRDVITKTVVADGEVIALGGLVQDRVENAQGLVPVLGRIPIIGYLFNNRAHTEQKENLLVLISVKIIDAAEQAGVNKFSQEYIGRYYDMAGTMHSQDYNKDPINKLFFDQAYRRGDHLMDKFIFDREERIKVTKKQRNRRRRGRKQPPVEEGYAEEPRSNDLSKEVYS